MLFTPHLFPLPKGEEGAVEWHLFRYLRNRKNREVAL